VITLEDSSPPADWYCPTCEKHFAAKERCPTDGTRLVRLSAANDPFIGRELDGRYTILDKLGQGGMGVVYRGMQHSVGRDCAIKVISPTRVSDAEAMKRFLREAKLASRLSHPNAVAVHDFGQTTDGVFYLAMELVEGRTLDEVLKEQRVFEPHRVVRIGSQVCDALDGAHAMQVVHRDLKPSNIMLLNRGRDLVKVLDFGLAKSLAPDTTPTTMTGTGDLLGTPAFMPPELARGQPCDGRADLYSLGCVLYLLGCGRLPFESSSLHEMVSLHGNQKAPPMTDVPEALAQVIDRMLEKDPAARYQTASECREALEAAVGGRLYTPVPDVPTSEDTHPSLGPFPKTNVDGAGETLPRAQRATSRPVMSPEMQRLASSPTMADSVTVPQAAAQLPEPPARRRPAWVIPTITAGVLAFGGGVFALTREETPDAVPSTPPAAAIAPEPMEPPPAVVTPPQEVTPPPVTTTPSNPPPKVKPAAISHKPKPTQPKPAQPRPTTTNHTTSAPHTDTAKPPF
jgi:serine/threonine-protein kinase